MILRIQFCDGGSKFGVGFGELLIGVDEGVEYIGF